MSETRVLLIDDEEVFVTNMCRLLNNRGLAAQGAVGGARGLELLADQPFDVVVLDLKMPGIDGMAVLAEIQKRGWGPEVLILTGHGELDSALEAIRQGAYDYLTKPCDPQELAAKIGEAQDRRAGKAGARHQPRRQ